MIKISHELHHTISSYYYKHIMGGDVHKGVGTQKLKLSGWGLGSGTPLETAVEGDPGRCWDGMNEVLIVVRPSDKKGAREGGWCQKPETEQLWHGFGARRLKRKQECC
jgi:hypothetical protein